MQIKHLIEQHLLMILERKQRLEGNFFILIKGIYQNPTANNLFHSKTLEEIPLKSFNIVLKTCQHGKKN